MKLRLIKELILDTFPELDGVVQYLPIGIERLEAFLLTEYHFDLHTYNKKISYNTELERFEVFVNANEHCYYLLEAAQVFRRWYRIFILNQVKKDGWQ